MHGSRDASLRLDEGVKAWKWRRWLFAWEEDLLRNCCFVLHNIVVQDGVLDRWKWLLDPIKDYSVSDVYHMFTTSDQTSKRVDTSSVWLKHVPLEMSFFVWRLFRNCLPTMDNLTTRGILHAYVNTCAGGCRMQESADHLLVGYVFLRLIIFVLLITFTNSATKQGFPDTLIYF